VSIRVEDGEIIAGKLAILHCNPGRVMVRFGKGLFMFDIAHNSQVLRSIVPRLESITFASELPVMAHGHPA